MFVIQEQGRGKGIPHGLDSFLERFDAICQEHLKAQRAKAFAFIFYDFADGDFRKILKDQGVFVQLDRLAGKNLSVFYLNSGKKAAVERFNSAFLSKLGVKDNVTLPCVVFFKVTKDGIEDVAVAQLDNSDLMQGFHELYGAIDRYIRTGANEAGIGSRALKWVNGGGIIIGVVVFKEVLAKAFELIVRL
jgi:hypothetical protein